HRLLARGVLRTGDLERAIGWSRPAPTSDRTVILALAADFVAGFATAGPATEPGVDVDLQLNAINVQRAYWGDRRSRCIPLGCSATTRGPARSMFATASYPTVPNESRISSAHLRSAWYVVEFRAADRSAANP
ncbi:MAG TPA: hypothetical protein VF086_09140, partial [Propionibacteriaceae bacterium]